MPALPEPSAGLRRIAAPVRFVRRLRLLPPRVARFHARARFVAWRAGDDAPLSALRPDDLAALLHVARGRREVVELGTARAWTTVSLALAEPRRRVTSYDPITQHTRERYLALAAPEVRGRISLVEAAGEVGPPPGLTGVDLLFIDASHEREDTVKQFQAWRPALAPGAITVFDDYGHPDFPGVAQAVADLGLGGETHGLLFVHRS